MARVEEAVLIGTGYMYMAAWAAGAAEPYTPIIGADTLVTDPAGNWEDIGFSEEGWNLVAENEYGFWTPAELVDPIATVKDSQTLKFRGVAAQFSLENLKIALGGGTITIETPGTLGTIAAIHKYVPPASTNFEFFSVLFRVATEGVNEESSEQNVRDFYIPKVISMATVDVQHNKGANPSLLGIEVQAVKPSGDIFEVYEQALAAA